MRGRREPSARIEGARPCGEVVVRRPRACAVAGGRAGVEARRSYGGGGRDLRGGGGRDLRGDGRAGAVALRTCKGGRRDPRGGGGGIYEAAACEGRGRDL
jgi:hypothetical protein